MSRAWVTVLGVLGRGDYGQPRRNAAAPALLEVTAGGGDPRPKHTDISITAGEVTAGKNEGDPIAVTDPSVESEVGKVESSCDERTQQKQS